LCVCVLGIYIFLNKFFRIYSLFRGDS
jgi:hypothetical protein